MLIALMVVPAEAGPRKRRAEAALEAPVRPEVADDATADAVLSPGSLYVDRTARDMFGVSANSRQVGDLVTVHISEYTATSLDASTTSSRGSSADYGVTGALGLDQSLINNNPGMGGGINIGGSSNSSFTGSGATSRGAIVDTQITCEIIEVNDNVLRIWGYKEVRVNREKQYVTFEGYARSRDIRLDNTIDSGRMAQAHIEVTGGGVLADKQGPGLFVRILDALWPF